MTIFNTRKQAVAIAAANQRDENEVTSVGYEPWSYTARQVPRGYVVDVADETGYVVGKL
jgi:hypothetical protein